SVLATANYGSGFVPLALDADGKAFFNSPVYATEGNRQVVMRAWAVANPTQVTTTTLTVGVFTLGQLQNLSQSAFGTVPAGGTAVSEAGSDPNGQTLAADLHAPAGWSLLVGTYNGNPEDASQPPTLGLITTDAAANYLSLGFFELRVSSGSVGSDGQ